MSALHSRVVGGDVLGEWSGLTAAQKARRVAFSLVAVLTLALSYRLLGEELALAVTGWAADTGVGPHQVHELTVFGMLWLALVVPVALMLVRPYDRVNAIIAPLVVLLPVAAFAAVVESPILALPVVFGGLALGLLALHPAGRGVFRFDRVERLPLSLAALLAAAAVPLTVYGGFQLAAQFTVPDEHTLFVHYGSMAVASLYVIVMGAFAVSRRRDWRFAAWSAGGVAAVVGATSVLFDVASSVGPRWGALLVAWAVLFVTGVEYVRYRDRTTRRIARTVPTDSD